jgi:prolyl oligopeptidase
VDGFRGRQQDPETFYHFTGFTTPGTVYRYDVETGQSRLFRQPALHFDPDLYITEQVTYRSQDGTRVPMFISYKQGLKRNGDNPTYLYGYGGFNIAQTPAFSVSNLVWMEMGGIYAQANLRGGGEYGKAWHEAGMKLKKQNVFDDFIAAAEWLIANGYTRTPRLAIGGRSNGGLLIGACLTQRPDLFGACLPVVGVLDMLRFHKFTIGWAWVSDYGSPDDPQEFKALLAYSPYHNVKPGTAYPPTLITTGDHDDRVFPAHSFKFAAALQAAQAGPAPTLIRIDTKAGHGLGKPTSKLIEEAADLWAFLVQALDMEAR